MSQTSIPQFVHLRTHSDYSISQGAIRCDELASFAANEPFRAIALTDNHNMFAAVKFYKSACTHKIKPIFGIEAHVYDSCHEQHFPWIFLATNQQGFLNLKKISSRSFTYSGKRDNQYVDKAFILNHHNGLIALAGGMNGAIGQSLMHGNTLQAKEELHQWQEAFGDRLFLEVQRINANYEEQYIEHILELSQTENCPVVATNNSCFPQREDFHAHEIKMCLYRGERLSDPERTVEHSQQQYLKPSTEMVALFADIPEAVINSVEIAKRCNVHLDLGSFHQPKFATTEGTLDEELEKITCLGFDKRIRTKDRDKDAIALYEKRVFDELQVIKQAGFSGYFLIVHEFISWALDNDISVGPGRGSVVGSLVAYCLHITNIDPIKNELLFERFLNLERISKPDIDIDFTLRGREKVIEHVTEKYGADAVCQVIAFGTMGSRNTIRDVTRVLGHPYGLGDRLAKMLPDSLGISLERAVNESDELKTLSQRDQTVQEIITTSYKLEGLVRHTTTHPAGLVIAPSNLINFTPLFHDPITETTLTQFDKDDIENIGLVKFDFLGLRTLIIIEDTLRSVATHSGQKIDIAQISLDDSSVFNLLSRGETDAVFQLESSGMKKSLRKLQPNTFEEIVAMLALYRPGPMQFINDFIARKHGQIHVNYDHPSLEPILKDTYGIAVYQEQVMRIAQVLAGYSLGKADLLRRAIGKKDLSIMAQERSTFIAGAIKKGINASTAQKIFAFIEKFAEYGFNKSHSAAYAVLSYQTAWLKVHHAIHFFVAVMNNEKESHDKLYTIYLICQKTNIALLPPHVNHSKYDFIVHDNSIIFGLGCIKGVGRPIAEALTKERLIRRFNSLYDFCHRVDRGLLDANVLEALICAGAFDGIGETRAQMHGNIPKALLLSEQIRQNVRTGVDDIFGGVNVADLKVYDNQKQETVWSDEKLRKEEKRFLGFYFTSHPCDPWKHDIERITTHDLSVLHSDVFIAEKIIVAGVVFSRKPVISAREERFVQIQLDDGVNHGFLRVPEEKVDIDHIADGKVVVVTLKHRQQRTENIFADVQEVIPIEQARYSFARAFVISLPEENTPHNMDSLRNVLKQFLSPKGKQVFIHIRKKTNSTQIKLGDQWRLHINRSFLNAFSRECPEADIKSIY